MPCPLSDRNVLRTIQRLDREFDTLDFIVACPRSGGTDKGTRCAEVVARGRAACGRRLTTFTRDHPPFLRRLNEGRTPAKWKQLGQLAPTPAPAPEARKPRSSMSVFQRNQQVAQVKWKEEVAGIAEPGELKGKPRRFLLPVDDWAHNILDPYRDEVVAHLEREGIATHGMVRHVRSSQAFALNLAAPFIAEPARLTPVLRGMLPELAERIGEVTRVEAEVIGAGNPFHEPGGRGAKRTSADLGVWWRDVDGADNLLLIEVKYTEAEFGGCALGRRTGEPCATGGRAIVEGDGEACPLTKPPHERTYWRLLAERELFEPAPLAAGPSCPFLGDGYQLMRNQLLAATIEADADAGIARADFAVLLHDDNPDIETLDPPLAGEDELARGWRAMLRDPARFHVLGAQRWLELAGRDDVLADWAGEVLARYFPGSGRDDDDAVDDEGEPVVRRRPAVRPGHRRSVAWMGSPDFAAIKEAHDRVLGEGTALYRATDRGVVTLLLDEDAPAFAGFRTSAEDRGHILEPGSKPPDDDALRARHEQARAWVRSVRRGSREERAVMAWLRTALRNRLMLPQIDDDWCLLAHEWRLVGERGGSRKTDVLAVHLASGRLGIVEAKGSGSRRAQAREQLRSYGQLWLRDADKLAPLFTELLRALGGLYGNKRAAKATVDTAEAALFFARPAGGAAVIDVRPVS